MAKFNKKKLTVALASALMGVCTVFAVACKKELEQITVTKSNAPQSVFVQGEALDFSDGKLTIVVDGERSDISFDDPDITISGYDANEIGKQTLTIEYQGKTTTFVVEVVPRMQITKYETSYFVGESISMKKGEVVVTSNDGKTEILGFEDEEIKLSTTTLTEANSAYPITVTYEKDGNKYESTFNVAVYEPESVELNVGQVKKAYKNHETNLDITNGYITLKAGDFSKHITLTEDMVSGFDPSVVGIEYRENPYEQTISVNYCGYEKSYKVQIRFSDYSLIMLRAKEMSELEWTDTDFPSEYEEAMGENAMEAIDVLFTTEEDMSLVQEEDVHAIVKVAAVYGLDKWQTTFASYKAAFYLTEAGTLSWGCEDYESTKAVYEEIVKKDSVLYKDAAILVEIAEKYADVEIYKEGETVSDILSVVYPPETIDSFIGQLKMMLDLHEAMEVPDDGQWTKESLSAYAESLENVWAILYESQFKATNYRSLYYLVSNWREHNDFFEILYTYFYNPDDFTKINAFKDLRLPGILEELYSTMLSARSELIGLQNGYNPETTIFMYCYEKSLLLKEEILNSNDEMLVDLYETLKFDYLVGSSANGYTLISFDELFNAFRSSNAGRGYVQNFNAFIGIKDYEDLWDAYMNVVDKAKTQKDYFESEEYGADAEGLLSAFINLSPKQQFAFMVLLQPYYEPTMGGRYPLEMWANDGENYYNQFTYLIYNYYEKVLPESTHEILTNLMLANEGLANMYLVAGPETFFAYMDNVARLRERLTREGNTKGQADWQAFNDKLEWLLIIMNEYYEKFSPLLDDPSANISEDNLTNDEAALLNELLNAVFEAYSIRYIYEYYIDKTGANLSLAYFATMEKVEALVAEIMASDNPSLLRAYYFDAYYLEDAVYPGGQVMGFGGYPLDLVVWDMRATYAKLLTGASYLKVGYLMLDAYNEINIKEYLLEANYLYRNYLYMQTNTIEAPAFQDVAQMMKIAKTFREVLTDEQRYFALVIDPVNMYSDAMYTFAKEQNAYMGNLAKQLLTVERMHVYYVQNPDGVDGGDTYKDMLLDAYELLMDTYERLQEEVAQEAAKEEPNEKKANAIADFTTYFGEMFAFYQEKCEALKNA